MSTETRHPRNCKTNCDWPACTKPNCVDPYSPHKGEFYKSMGEVLLAIASVSMVLLVVVGLIVNSCTS